MIKVKIVHGSWREEDSNRQSIEVTSGQDFRWLVHVDTD